MKKFLFVFLILCIPCILSGVSAVAEPKIIHFWSYYNFPPFIQSLNPGQGLSFEFAELLSNPHKKSFNYAVEWVPRKRIDRMLEKKNEGIILWVNPVFFDDIKREKYFWTEPLLRDQQDFISLPAVSYEFDGSPDSLKGLLLGGIYGHRYFGIQAAIDAGEIQRHDVTSELQNIKKVLSGRIDVTTLPHSTMKFYEQKLKLTGKIHYSKKPLNTYSRHILIPRYMASIHTPIVQRLKKIKASGELSKLFKKYEVQRLQWNSGSEAFLY